MSIEIIIDGYKHKCSSKGDAIQLLQEATELEIKANAMRNAFTGELRERARVYASTAKRNIMEKMRNCVNRKTLKKKLQR